jgi:hypothetical protein
MSHPTASDAASVRAEVREFLRRSCYMRDGTVMTDLDGTAVHEVEGRVTLPRLVAEGLKRVHDSGRRVVINTLRYPLSVLSAFAGEWYHLTREAIPLVALKGSQIGQIAPGPRGTLVFEEFEAFTLSTGEIEEVMQGVQGMVSGGAEELLVFFYPRDWRAGERLWTPDPARVAATAAKYRSASEVFSGPVQQLADRLSDEAVCLIFLLVDVPEDRRMAYQHTERTRFVTHVGVDKRHGARAMARCLEIDLLHSVGAGDGEADTFLTEVGLAAIVGNAQLDFKGRVGTLRLPDPLAWGRVLLELGASGGLAR